ncbi:MAG: preprotein translocase subunit SecY [Candidatus Babeliaceae bacterium]|nr:preprotein translocase subunit SecY [Candidatus Babeliaceae bacterium]
MVLFNNFWNIFKIPELSRKLFFTLTVLIIYRIGVFIPVSGINIDLLAETMKSSNFVGGFLSYLNTFSGGALQQCALFALGISPYIVASLVMQFASMAIPQLEALSKEGEYGRRIINQYTRYLTLILGIVYSSGLLTYLATYNLVLTPGIGFKLFFVLCLTSGAMFVMWLGEQISLYGLGNGSSMLIFAGIVSAFPQDVLRTVLQVQEGNMSLLVALGILAFFITVAAAIVYLEKGERKIPVHYARRVVGQRVYGGQSTYIPFKINNVGVMPAIFASTILSIPSAVFSFLANYFNWEALSLLATDLSRGGVMYNILTFVLIIVFTFVYTSIIFDPNELSQNLKKNGGFIPGIRPGKQTADELDKILTRLGLVGAIYLACLALLPNILQALVYMPFVLGGTSLLIVVGVGLELSSQLEAYLLESNYAGFLTSGSRIKSRAAR